MSLLKDLTLRIKANSADLQSGLKNARGAVNRFSKEMKDRGKHVKKGFQNIKDGVVNMASSMTSGLSAATGGLSDLALGFPKVIAGIKGVTTGMNLLKVAIASTGIGLLVVALGSLVAYFTKTQRGADLLSQGMAGIGAVVTTLIDTLSGFGETLVSIWNEPGKAVEGFGNSIKDFVLGRIELLMGGLKGMGTAFKKLFEGDFAGAAKTAGESLLDITRATSPLAWGLEGLGAAVDGITEKFGKASEKAKAAMQLERDGQALERKRLQYKQIAATQELAISDLILKSKEKETYTEKQRVEFIRQAQKIQKALSTQNVAFAEEELRIKRGIDALGENMLKDDQATAELAVKVLQLKKEENDKTRKLVNRENEALNALKTKEGNQAKINAQKAEELRISKELAAIASLDKVESQKAELDFSVTVPDLSDKIQPIQQDFSLLKETLYNTGLGFQELQNFSLGLDLLPAVEQVALLDDKLNQLIPTFSSIGEAMTAAFNTFGNTIQAAAVQGGQNLKDLAATAKESAHQIIRSLIAEGVAALVASALKAAGMTGPLGLALAPGLAAAAGAIATSAFSSLIPAFANGGTTPGGLTLVGERGPELAALPKGTQITRANKTEQLLGQANNIHVTIDSRIKGQDLEQVITEVKRRNGNNY